jgi:hypothetical protein
VLDGSASAEPDARLYEWGLERESATDGHFQFINPGAGALNLEVDGTVAATGLDCPDCVTSATIDDLSVGAADLATGAVTTTKIAAGAVGASALHTNAVTTVALADGAVTGAKVADGAVGASALHTSAVTTAALADGAVTGVKIADGAVGASTIRSNAVTSIHLTDDAVSGAEIADGAVQTADLAGSAVTSAKIADGTITEADISPTSAIYVSKSQLYERDEQGTLDIVGGLYVEVCCDDANDLPMIASCDVSGPNLQLYGEESLDWSSTTDPAGWNCRFYNTTGGSFTGYAKILCISVP